MNSLGLIYKEIPIELENTEVVIPSSNNVFKIVRQHIKPLFNCWKLKANNLNGEGARSFNRKIGRFKSDWLEFEILDFEAPDDFYPTDSEITTQHLVQETAVASKDEWYRSVEKEVSEGKCYLLVGLTALIEQRDFRLSMLSSGIPARHWPCKFEIFECLVTNAPICQFIRHRSNVYI